jgi:hypothetical protein
MHFVYRVLFVAALIGAAWYGQRELSAHLEPARLPPAHQIAPAAALIPRSLGAWHGEDETIGNAAAASLGDLKRNYFHAATGQAATLYVTYTPAGLAPTGSVEAAAIAAAGMVDPGVPSTFELAPDVTAAQFRLASRPSGRWLFRWSYDLPLRHEPKLDRAQSLYRRLRRSPPHVTIEIFVPENDPTDPESVRELARLVDAAVRPILGAEGILAGGKDGRRFAYLAH